MAITTNMIIIYLYYISLLLTQELCLCRKTYRTLSVVREAESIQRKYREFQVVNTYAMKLFGPFFVFFMLPVF